MLFAKKRQRAVLRLVELPTAGRRPLLTKEEAPESARGQISSRRTLQSLKEMFAFGMKMDEQALEPGTDEIRGKHGTGHYTGGARHDRDLRFKYH
ncbi:hypothetical protein GBA52_015318 [Prunus armeniaca]|nr:hypothetical protein GBA52_015318 [Prunus armeniaca]